jgi:hypothetical protein
MLKRNVSYTGSTRVLRCCKSFGYSNLFWNTSADLAKLKVEVGC